MSVFDQKDSDLNSPATTGAAVTPNDSADLAETSRALFIGTGGTLVVTLRDDTSSLTFLNVASGQVLPLRVKRIHDTGTTAANIIALR